MHDGRHGARSRPEGTHADLGARSRPPLAVQQEATTRLLNDIHDFVRGPPVPAPDWSSVLLCSRLNCNMEEIQAPENVTWDQLLPGLPSNKQAATCKAGRCA